MKQNHHEFEPENKRQNKKPARQSRLRFASFLLGGSLLLGCAGVQKAPATPEKPVESIIDKEFSKTRRGIIIDKINGINGKDSEEIESAASFFVKSSVCDYKKWLKEMVELAEGELSDNSYALWRIIERMVVEHSKSNPSVAIDFTEIIWRDNYDMESWHYYMFYLISDMDSETQEKILDEILANELTDHSSYLGLMLLYKRSEGGEPLNKLAGYWHDRIDSYQQENSGPFNILYNMPILIGFVYLRADDPLMDIKFTKKLGWRNKKGTMIAVFLTDEVQANIAYGLTLLSKSEMVDVYKKFNITHFIRYPPYVIRNLAKIANGKKPEKPVALIITPKEDHNHAFYLNNSPLRDSKKSAYEYIIFEAGTDKEAIDFMYNFPDKYPFSVGLLGVFGHGGNYVDYGGCNENMECFEKEFSGAYLGGPDMKAGKAYVFNEDSLYLDTEDKKELEKVAKKLELTDDAVIVVDSCKGGKEEGLGPLLEEIFDRPVLSIGKNYTDPKFTYDGEGKIKSMTYIPADSGD